jgi:hypothetical protein
MYEDQVKVNLIEGSVLVSSNDNLSGDGLRLGPSMQASYRQGDYIPRISQTYDNDNSLAWLNGKLVLDDLALNDALPLINRYLETPLMLADHSTGAIRIGGIYNIKELNTLVATLPKVSAGLPDPQQRGQPGPQLHPATTAEKLKGRDPCRVRPSFIAASNLALLTVQPPSRFFRPARAGSGPDSADRPGSVAR